ncbi:hypothetical protein [Halobacillus litoralis]|uniref:hypothetical protein n=1 Tax=Halobacillus litoralis TaxID=45668 RepID=UPI001CFE02AF|nr:hypothetical protein [Halobacillus litoralis]
MTAEVAIMNKTGVALAADSAVTVGSRGFKKIYNSANKLFSLSKIHPVGIMINGSANFMSIPWETIIKEYRDYLGDVKFDSFSSYSTHFWEYVKNDSRFNNPELEINSVIATYMDVFISILETAEEELIKLSEESNDLISEEQQNHILLNNFNYMLERFKDNTEKVININYDDFSWKFGPQIEELTREYIGEQVSEEVIKIAQDLAYEIVISEHFSGNSSGVVLAGYGDNDIFPSLTEYKVEGFICGQLKIHQEKQRKVGFEDESGSAFVLPFAQKEMVSSFMSGIDPNLQEMVDGFIYRALTDYPTNLVEKAGVPLDEKQVKLATQMGKDIYRGVIEGLQRYQEDKFINPVLEIVDMLPKEELAEMAEALVNLTSFKRRVSTDDETVGGPIDVAVITKGDGLIWIKRKHYFQPELNYQFFQNYIRSVENDNIRK